MYTPERRGHVRLIHLVFGTRVVFGRTRAVSRLYLCVSTRLSCAIRCVNRTRQNNTALSCGVGTRSHAPHTRHMTKPYLHKIGAAQCQCRGPQRAGAAKNRVVSAANTYPDAHLKTHASLITASKVGTAIGVRGHCVEAMSPRPRSCSDPRPAKSCEPTKSYR